MDREELAKIKAVNLPWNMVVDAIEKDMEALYRQMETARPDEILKIQGKLQALRNVLDYSSTKVDDPDKRISSGIDPYAH